MSARPVTPSCTCAGCAWSTSRRPAKPMPRARHSKRCSAKSSPASMGAAVAGSSAVRIILPGLFLARQAIDQRRELRTFLVHLHAQVTHAGVPGAVVGDLERVRTEDLERLVECLFVYLRVRVATSTAG